MASTHGPISESLGSTSSSLIERVRSHDEEAWRRLVRVYGPLVAYWVKRAGLQPADAADVLQEVFRAVAQGVGRFRKERPEDTFRGWLCGITRFKVADHFRRRGAEPAAEGGSDAARRLGQVPDAPDDPDDDEAEALHQLRLRAFELVQAEFEPRTWQMFWAVTAESQTTREVADTLGVTVSAVRVVKSRVMRRLRQVWEDLIDEL